MTLIKTKHGKKSMTFTKTHKMRKRIVKDATRLFSIQGYDKTSIRQIAAEVEFKNQASLYYYFKNKKEIALEIFNRYYAALNDFVFSLPESQNDQLLALTLREICNCHLVFLDEDVAKFFIESNTHYTSLDILYGSEHSFVDSICSYLMKNKATFDKDDLEMSLLFYLSGTTDLVKVYWGVPKKSNLSFEKLWKQLPYIFLEVLQIDYDKRKKLVNKAYQIFSNIPADDLKKLSIFNPA